MRSAGTNAAYLVRGAKLVGSGSRIDLDAGRVGVAAILVQPSAVLRRLGSCGSTQEVDLVPVAGLGKVEKGRHLLEVVVVVAWSSNGVRGAEFSDGSVVH